MRLTVVFIVLFVTHFVMSAQNSLEKNVGTFDEVKVYDLIEVNLVKSNENKVVISGNEADNVEIINKNNKLKIRMKLDKIFKGESTFVTVYYSALKTIDGNEGSLIISNETIDQDYIELKAQEGARLKINANVNKLNIRAVSGGIVEVSGKGNAQDIVLNTGGIYQGQNFETQTTNVTISAAGEANVFATNTVNAKVRAGGDVNIYGQPKNINETTTLGGRIKRME